MSGSDPTRKRHRRRQATAGDGGGRLDHQFSRVEDAQSERLLAEASQRTLSSE